MFLFPGFVFSIVANERKIKIMCDFDSQGRKLLLNIIILELYSNPAVYIQVLIEYDVLGVLFSISF